jgi:hypothetical protein
VLTLGEKASIVIDRYVYDPHQNVGETMLQATKGALHFVSDRIKGLKQKRLPLVADIGVRGTEFWGGPPDKYGVLVLKARDKSGRQHDPLSGSHGCSLTTRSGSSVKAASAEKIARAVATVALH